MLVAQGEVVGEDHIKDKPLSKFVDAVYTIQSTLLQ